MEGRGERGRGKEEEGKDGLRRREVGGVRREGREKG